MTWHLCLNQSEFERALKKEDDADAWGPYAFWGEEPDRYPCLVTFRQTGGFGVRYREAAYVYVEDAKRLLEPPPLG